MEGKEIRGLFTGELRVLQAEGAAPKITGYAAMFGKLSKTIKTERRAWREKIMPGAFTRSLQSEGDIFAFVEHNPSQKLARRSNGSLKLSQDENGLAVEINPPDTTVGRDAMEEIRNGLLSGWSFGFVAKPSDQSWYRNEQDGWMREIRALDLLEVTLTGSPAYPDSTILNLRSADEAEKYLEEWETECQKQSQEIAAEQQRRERHLRLLQR